VTAALTGFGTVVRENVDVSLNRTEVADFELSPMVTGEVVVTASEAPINTSNAEVKARWRLSRFSISQL
jgi:hypothetical protein